MGDGQKGQIERDGRGRPQPFVKVIEWARSWHYAHHPIPRKMPLILIYEASSASVTGSKKKKENKMAKAAAAADKFHLSNCKLKLNF